MTYLFAHTSEQNLRPIVCQHLTMTRLSSCLTPRGTASIALPHSAHSLSLLSRFNTLLLASRVCMDECTVYCSICLLAAVEAHLERLVPEFFEPGSKMDRNIHWSDRRTRWRHTSTLSDRGKLLTFTIIRNPPSGFEEFWIPVQALPRAVS